MSEPDAVLVLAASYDYLEPAEDDFEAVKAVYYAKDDRGIEIVGGFDPRRVAPE